MESNGDLASYAKERLREYERLETSADEREPARQYWWLMLWSAVFIASYAAVHLFTLHSFTSAQGVARAEATQSAWVMLIPVLAFSGLINGARERFRVRRKPSLLQWGVIGLALAGFMALIGLSILGTTYPWWLNALVPLTLLSVALPLIRRLVTTPHQTSTTWSAGHLSAASRLMTALIGILIGVQLVTSGHTFAVALSFLVAMVFMGVILIGWRSSFGFPRVGYEWGALQWACFGACAAMVFLCVLLNIYAGWFTNSHSVVAGVLVFATMGAAAVLPQRSTGG